MNIFYVLFLLIPILGFLGVYLTTGNLTYAIILLLIIDVIFTFLFVTRKRKNNR
ncbi:hypothetical protein ACFOU0_00925 [Salinicoccus sesuvii]|uniref:Uncharacterized protein n=1 Tax=Salinicoccus sesuvii TaxID=868281 RepID=A0ABV7N3I7_9STAP